MTEQALFPDEWIIVNDGSTDKTGTIIQKVLKKYKFIKYLQLPDRGYRKPGKGVVEAFNEGLKKISIKDYDILAKFDGDLKFPPDTLESIRNAFLKNPKLGITGGTRYERLNNTGPFKKAYVPYGFICGDHKFYRKQCFEHINGLIPRAGWDGIDTIKANMKGWETWEIEDLKIFHLRQDGTAKGEGLKKAFEKDGDINYYMGGYLWYFFLRVILRSIQRRNQKIGYYMINGYLKSKRNNIVRESDDFRKFLKKVQLKNMIYWIKLALNFKKSKAF